MVKDGKLDAGLHPEFILSVWSLYLVGGERRVRPATRRLGVAQQAADLHRAAAAAGGAHLLAQRRTLWSGGVESKKKIF